MSDTEKTELDALFAAAREEQPALSDPLTDRILADAAAWQPKPLAKSPPGIVAQLIEMLGGWPALGGLATATMAGLYFGFVQPELVVPGSVTAALSEETELDLEGFFPDDTMFFEEG